MPSSRAHREAHRADRIGWLRAAVLGANDGIVSTASLVIGVAAAGAEPRAVLMTGVAGLVGGAMSMAAGEYISVHSQSDTEAADLLRESAELLANPAAEQRELAAIYAGRGLSPALAGEVAAQFTRHDALGAHMRDELGRTEHSGANPLQAALASAASFAVGAALPLGVAVLASGHGLLTWVSASSLVSLAGLGIAAARAGGAGLWRSAARVTFWGAAAMLVTAGAGHLFGVVAA